MPNTENKSTEYAKQKEIMYRLSDSFENIERDLQLLKCTRLMGIDLTICLIEFKRNVMLASTISTLNALNEEKTETASNCFIVEKL